MKRITVLFLLNSRLDYYFSRHTGKRTDRWTDSELLTWMAIFRLSQRWSWGIRFCGRLLCATALLVPFCQAVKWDEVAECRKWNIVLVSCVAGRTSGNEGPVISDVASHPRRTATPCIWMFVDDTSCVPVEFFCWVCGKFLWGATLPL